MKYLFALLILAGCVADETLSAFAPTDAEYHLQTMNGKRVTYKVTMVVSKDGQIKGQAPCNSYATATTVPYPWFEVLGIIATRKACPQLPQEAEYFRTLKSMTLAEVSGTVLLLTNDNNNSLTFMSRE